MATKNDVVAALTDWLCDWVDLPPQVVRKQVFLIKNSIEPIDERDARPFASKIDVYTFNALRSFEERFADIGLRFSPTDTHQDWAAQALANPDIGAPGLSMIRELVADFNRFAMTPQFNASQVIGNCLRLIRTFSRSVII